MINSTLPKVPNIEISEEEEREEDEEAEDGRYFSFPGRF